MLQELSAIGLTLNLHVYYCPRYYSVTNKYLAHPILIALKIVPKSSNTTETNSYYDRHIGYQCGTVLPLM